MCSLASMILADGEVEINADNIKALLDASGNEVAAYWPGIFSSHMKDGKINTLLNTLGGGGGGGGDAAGAEDAPAAEEKKEEKKVEEEVDFSGGMDMFGGGGGGGGDY